MDTKLIKQKILDLAIRGKLVPQNPADEPASVLLERIKAEKATSTKGKKGIETNLLIDDSDIPYKKPSGWVFARVKDFIKITGGSQPAKEFFEFEKTENNIRLIQIRDYKSDKFITYIPKDKAKRFCSKDDVMIGRYGPPLFQILRGIEGSYNVALMKAESDERLMYKEYLFYLLKDNVLLKLLESVSDRTCGQDGVNMYVLNNYIFGIPPLAEQKRIVAEIDRWFKWIDELEQNQQDLHIAIKQAKSKILDLAIHGKLVPQDPNDESLPVSEIHEGLFEIPTLWKWANLKSICSKLVDGDHNPPKGLDIVSPYIMASSKNINNNELVDLKDVRYLSEESFNKCDARTKATKGDILLTTVGTLGRSCIFNGNLNITFQRSVTILSTMINNLYVKYFFDSLHFQNYMNENSRGTAQKGFYLNQLESVKIPIPPIKEQKRIVSKIEELFVQLDKIEECLN